MITLQNVHKQFGPKVLFQGVNFHLKPGEKVGLVGENGMGKTTLFRVILGLEPVEAGQVTVRKGAQVALLGQELESGPGSLLERVVLGDPHFRSVKEDMDRLAHDGGLKNRSPEDWGRRYGNLQHEFERLGGYEREARAQAILSGLGFKAGHWDRPLTEFSGGWRMRGELARLLLQKPDVLLLDEPTNHLDLKSVEWLESFLKTYDGGLLLISHDRWFLNRLVERIAELDRGVLTSYTGNYDTYEKEKSDREARLEAAAANQERRIAEVQRFIDRFRAKNTKATQVQSKIKMLDKMERVETVSRTKTVHFRFPQPVRTGRIVVALQNVDKSYGPVSVYRDFNTHLERGWKVALVGPNGAGKSTLLRLLAGVLEPDSGTIKLGANVTRAYFAQHQSEILNPGHTVLESLEEVGAHLTRTRKQTILGAFLFSGDDVNKKVAVLSGGERSRLALARMLTDPASFLLLDEPTNHLDMRSTEFLAAALADYEGTLCMISHDRHFLDGIIDRVWEIDNGRLREFVGNYTDYERVTAGEAERAAVLRDESQPDLDPGTPARKDRDRKRREAEDRNARHRRLKPLRARLKQVEARLERVMEKKQTTEHELADPAVHEPEQKDRLLSLIDRQRKLAEEEDRLLWQWDDLTQSIEQVIAPPAVES